MDPLSDVMRSMRFTGGIFLDAEFTAPWCVSSGVLPEDCIPFGAIPRNIMAYHYVEAGECLIAVDGHPPVVIAKGEIALLPHNDRHLLGDDLSLSPADTHALILPPPSGEPLARIRHGGGGERTRILCGFLGNDLPNNPVLAALPPCLKLAMPGDATGEWIESTFRFAASALAGGGERSAAVLGKLAELLFEDTVYRYLDTMPEQGEGWLAGLRDPVIGRALALLHADLNRRWTTEDLATEIGLSRSAFAARFTELVGEPPMRYLATWRMTVAARRLSATRDPIAGIAFDAGYESEAAFSRAFKRSFGMPPAAWRRENARPETARD
ncbi:MAG: AraC family transcriptional regulator [Parvibaculum sp.]